MWQSRADENGNGEEMMMKNLNLKKLQIYGDEVGFLFFVVFSIFTQTLANETIIFYNLLALSYTKRTTHIFNFFYSTHFSSFHQFTSLFCKVATQRKPSYFVPLWFALVTVVETEEKRKKNQICSHTEFHQVYWLRLQHVVEYDSVSRSCLDSKTRLTR